MNKKQRNRRNRIAISLVCFLVLMILELTGVLDGVHGFVLFVIYFIPYIIVGNDVIIKAAKNIRNGQVFDENFLMMIATFAAFGLGLFGDTQYSEALAVMLFYQIGEAFQDYAVGQSRASITEMMAIAPESAFVLNGDETEEVDPEDVEIGSVVVVRPGDKVPLDGVVIEGESFIDTSALTGESVPRRVSEGDDIISGCVNGEGMLKVKVTKEYDDSTVAKILELVENASARKAVLENFVTRFARVYTPIVTIGAALLAVAMPLVFGLSWSDGIERACNFLIVSCPCALVISVPLGFFGGIGAASKVGVLVKGSNFLEAAASLDTMVFDKTGTLTKGEFKVSKLVPAEGVSEDELIELAAYGEAFATHPIGKSILEAAKDKEIDKSRL
ncbi:MAG: HAD-IC family P-type ATPase, partial [Mogibacterium diversum]|nr:HAD-IC family P-type ATPase [Mogibacterium diversum]